MNDFNQECVLIYNVDLIENVRPNSSDCGRQKHDAKLPVTYSVHKFIFNTAGAQDSTCVKQGINPRLMHAFVNNDVSPNQD